MKIEDRQKVWVLFISSRAGYLTIGIQVDTTTRDAELPVARERREFIIQSIKFSLCFLLIFICRPLRVLLSSACVPRPNEMLALVWSNILLLMMMMIGCSRKCKSLIRPRPARTTTKCDDPSTNHIRTLKRITRRDQQTMQLPLQWPLVKLLRRRQQLLLNRPSPSVQLMSCCRANPVWPHLPPYATQNGSRLVAQALYFYYYYLPT